MPAIPTPIGLCNSRRPLLFTLLLLSWLLVGQQAIAGHLPPVDPIGSNEGHSHENHSGHDHSGAVVSTSTLQGIDLSGANLTSSVITSSTLSSANLSGADLTSATLTFVNLTAADLSGANLTSSVITTSDLTLADLTSADLTSSVLNSANLSGADLTLANLSFVNLSGANLTSANLHLAVLSGTLLPSLPVVSGANVVVNSTLTVHGQTNVAGGGLLTVSGSGPLLTDAMDVQNGGAIRVELSSPNLNNITADLDVNIAASSSLTVDPGSPPVGGAILFRIIRADADGNASGTVNGEFDTLNLPADDGLGRRYSILYEHHSGDGVGVIDTIKIGLARPGDANFSGVVDSLDLLAASPLFGSTTPATWRQGNWNDTGGSKGIVDAIDLFDASPFFEQTYGSGELALGGDATTPGQNADGNPSICYDYTTGEVTIDTDGNDVNTYVLDSLSGIFTGAAANFIGGTFFQTDNDFRIAENFHTNLNGVHNLGAVAQTGLNLGFLLNDLTLQGGSAGNPNFEFDLVVKNTPEPSTIVLVGFGLVALVGVARRRMS